MRVVFAGTPAFSVPCLEALLRCEFVEVVAVYTQPDRPAGRGKKLQQSPVKQKALDHDIAVLQPESLQHSVAVARLRELQPDLMVVTAYGLLLPQDVLDVPGLGCVNVHASLLPRWRGAAPIQRAIQAGDEYSGVTLMKMVKALDAGSILASEKVTICGNETGGSLHHRLAILGSELLYENLPQIKQQSLEIKLQDESVVTYADKLSKSEARLNWQLDSTTLERKIRAFNPWPVATSRFGDHLLRIHRGILHQDILVETDNTSQHYAPGEVVSSDANGILVMTGSGLLNLQKLQKPGGKSLPVAEFLNGMPVPVGSLFT